MTFQTFDLVVAEIYFEDCDETKIRPVLIVEDRAYFVSCLPITSNTSRPEDYVIKEWKASGLKKPSSIRIHKAIELDPSFISHKIGRLQPIDILEVQKMILG